MAVSKDNRSLPKSGRAYFGHPLELASDGSMMSSRASGVWRTGASDRLHDAEKQHAAGTDASLLHSAHAAVKHRPATRGGRLGGGGENSADFPPLSALRPGTAP